MIWFLLYFGIGFLVATIAVAYAFVCDTQNKTVEPSITDWLTENTIEDTLGLMVCIILFYPLLIIWLLWLGLVKFFVWLIK